MLSRTNLRACALAIPGYRVLLIFDHTPRPYRMREGDSPAKPDMAQSLRWHESPYLMT